MFRKLHTRVTPASVLATAALFASLGGGAYAAATIDGGDILDNSVSGKDIKNRSIAVKDIKKKTVNSLRGKTGPQGPEGPAGPQGVEGVQGPAGTALAYAQVGPSTPSLVTARTSGIVSVDRPGAGLYCLTPTADVIAQAFDAGGDPTRATVASVEYGNSSTQTDTLIVQVRGATINCPDNTFELRTYRNGVLSNTVAFTLLVP